jgi:transposase-like protein
MWRKWLPASIMTRRTLTVALAANPPSTIRAEYRRRIIELARAGRSVNELARESSPRLRRFASGSNTALDDGLRCDGLTTSEGEELNQLRRKNRVLGEEREILAKATWRMTKVT